MYAMFLSIPIHFGKFLCPDSTSNILIIASMGEGTVSGIYAILIKHFGPKSLYLITLASIMLMLVFLKLTVRTLTFSDP